MIAASCSLLPFARTETAGEEPIPEDCLNGLLSATLTRKKPTGFVYRFTDRYQGEFWQTREILMLRVFRFSESYPELVDFDRDAVISNFGLGRQTSIILDTNVMVEIEGAYRTKQPHAKLTEAGIIHFARMVAKNAKYGVFISPAAAYQELPPARRAPVEVAFNRFVKYYLPKLGYDPDKVTSPFTGESVDLEKFAELPRDRQELRSVSYACLLAINVVHRIRHLAPTDKFNCYIDYCAEVLNLISLKEVFVARYVFSSEVGINELVRKRKVSLVNNFVKIKKSVAKNLPADEVIKRISLNGANDIALITTLDAVNNTRSQFIWEDAKHDAWLATSDEKLYEFCRACPSLSEQDGGKRLARGMELHAEITGTDYWKESAEILGRKLDERRGEIDQEMEMGPVLQAAFQIEALLADGTAEKFFENRLWRDRR
ncbi:hypothetical protein [Sphingomonas faeni]|uniref:hypothetical protein n=1 Tax=Sphingomonas faeni TaxID=185950 RepID=UPI00334965F0